MKSKKKPLFEPNRIPLYEKIPLDTPMSVTIDPSSLCNLKCIYCAQALGEKFEQRHFKRQLMDFDLFEQIIKQLHQFPQQIKKMHLFRNGESLCNPRIADMIALAKKSKVCESININTNGVLLNDKLSLDIIDAGLDSLSISLQGINNKKYKSIGQAKVDFSSLVKDIKFFYEHRGSCKLFIKNIDVALDEGEEERFYQIFGDIADRVYIETACPVYRSIDYSKILKKDNVTRHGEDVLTPSICQIAFFHLHILANGDIIPCSSIDSPVPLWNVKSTTLLDMWNSKERIEFLKLQAENKRDTNAICKECHRLSQELRPEDNIDQYSSLIIERLNGGNI